MKKELVTEAKRLQELAGIDEVIKIKKPDTTMDILARNGIDDDYFEAMGGKEIEGGSEEWLDVIEDITGKHPYTDEFDDEDNEKIEAFMEELEKLGIEFY